MWVTSPETFDANTDQQGTSLASTWKQAVAKVRHATRSPRVFCERGLKKRFLRLFVCRPHKH